jgi:uncharacterized protein (UPF0264 family)
MAGSELLVSVRSALEAKAALMGGANIIDVKEPRNGSLGRSDLATIAEVIGFVRKRVQVSAALGELTEHLDYSPPSGLDFAKWGLAKCSSRWREQLQKAAARWAGLNRRLSPVAVAYADWHEAQSPPPDDVWTFARDNQWRILLLDTFRKGEGTLLDWMSLGAIRRVCERCRDHQIRIALAGSLGRNEISTLLPLEPDIFAVRGSICRGSDRTATVDEDLVRRMSRLIRGSSNTL